MSRILFTSMPFAGHIRPGLPIARELVGAGHEVLWYTGQKYAALVAGSGATFVPYPESLDFDDADVDERRRAPGQARSEGPAQGHPGGVPAAGGRARRRARSGRSRLPAGRGRDRAHLHRRRVARRAAADPAGRLRGHPADAVQHRHGPVRHGVAAVQHVAGSAAQPGAERRDASGDLPWRAAAGGPAAGFPRPAAAARLLPGLDDDPGRSVPGAERAGIRVPPQRSAGLGPVRRRLSARRRRRWVDAAVVVGRIGPGQVGRPVVLVTQGTLATDPDNLLRPAIAALADQDVLVIATSGGPYPDTVLPERDRPATVRIEPFVPFTELLHAGRRHGHQRWVRRGADGPAYGVPLVGAGTTEDKMEVNARVAHSGAGVSLKVDRPTSAQVLSGVRTVLDEPSYRARAGVLQRAYARYGGA